MHYRIDILRALIAIERKYNDIVYFMIEILGILLLSKITLISGPIRL